MFKKQIILVDENDNPIGQMEKLKAHQLGALHRAFSVFIFNDRGEMLLQKRANNKYHSAGLWSNACCSHPENEKGIAQQAQKRLEIEMSIKNCPLQEIFSYLYEAPVGQGLIEHEIDHVFVGLYNGEVKINKKEAEDYQWISPDELKKAVKEQPENFTAWLKAIFIKVLDERDKNIQETDRVPRQ